MSSKQRCTRNVMMMIKFRYLLETGTFRNSIHIHGALFWNYRNTLIFIKITFFLFLNFNKKLFIQCYLLSASGIRHCYNEYVFHKSSFYTQNCFFASVGNNRILNQLPKT